MAPGTGRLRDVVTPDDRRAAYEAAGLWNDDTLARRVVDHARAHPGAAAVIDGSGRHDYASLASDAAACAAALAQRGFTAGAVVSVQLPNRYETVVAAVAIQSLGAVINPLLPNYRAHELTGVFVTARPVAVFTPGVYRGFDHRPLVAEVAKRTGVTPLHVVVGDAAPAAGLTFDDLLQPGAGPADGGAGRAPAVSELIFTSGTEARPKAIMHTEQTANFSVRVAASDLGVTPTDVVWMPSPLGHSTGFNYGLRLALYHRLALVLQDEWDPARAVELIEAHGCSYTLAATTFLQDLVGCGGAPVPPALVDAAAERDIGVLRLYGSTEVLVGTWNRPHSPAAKRRETDGPPMSHVEVEVRDPEGRSVPPGRPGEAFVRGPNTCVGFFDDAERTAATFDPAGWVRSGDMVTVDADGYLTVVGRKKEIIIRGGLNIAPAEIETLLVGFPEVERAAVVGIPDARLGERTCACIVLVPRASLDLEQAVERLRAAGLATYKLPQRLEVLDSSSIRAGPSCGSRPDDRRRGRRRLHAVHPLLGAQRAGPGGGGMPGGPGRRRPAARRRRRHRHLQPDARLGAGAGGGQHPGPARAQLLNRRRPRGSGALPSGLTGGHGHRDRPRPQRAGVPRPQRPVGPPGRRHAVPRHGGPVPLSRRLRRLPHVRGYVGPALPARDRPAPGGPGAVPIAQRLWAADNERAVRRSPLTWDEYRAAAFVAEPFRAPDCTIEVDGACAVVVSSLEQARHLRHPPAVISSGAYWAGAGPGLDIGDHLLWDDYTRNYTSGLREELFSRAGLRPADVQVAQIYDCFSSTVLLGLEGLGLCERGGAAAFVRSGATGPGGALPVNTNGGLLAEGYLHGMNTVAEAVLQVQGRGRARQVPRHEVCVVTSGALMDGSALVLTADR